MRKGLILLVLPVLLSVSIISCKNNDKKTFSKECIDLNNKAFEHLKKYMDADGDTHQLDTTLDILKEAVECDSTYLIAYSNMRVTYGYMANYDEAIAIDNKMIKLSPKHLRFLFDKAMLFDKIGKRDSANWNYNLVKTRYENSLPKASDISENISQIVLLTALIDGKDQAIKELAKQMKTHPELPELTDTTMFGKVYFLKDFNRINYVKDNIGEPITQYVLADKKSEDKFEKDTQIQVIKPAQNPTKLNYKLYKPTK